MPQHSDFKFLAVTALVVALLGVQAFRDTFGDELKSGEIEVHQAQRLPASVSPKAAKPSPSSAASKVSSSMLLDWNLNCEKPGDLETEVHSSYLRLRGKACGDLELQNAKIQLTNETNGFTASIFTKGKSSYETDLIQLREGANRLRLDYMTSTGRRIETIFTVISKTSVL